MERKGQKLKAVQKQLKELSLEKIYNQKIVGIELKEQATPEKTSRYAFYFDLGKSYWYEFSIGFSRDEVNEYVPDFQFIKHMGTDIPIGVITSNLQNNQKWQKNDF